MPVRTLAAAVHALITDDAGREVVVVVQRWSGFARGQQRFVVSRSGVVVTNEPGTPDEVEEVFGRAEAGLAGSLLPGGEVEARAHLERLGVSGHVVCESCGGMPPIAAPWCPKCGTSRGRAVSGRLSGARRREAVHIRTQG